MQCRGFAAISLFLLLTGISPAQQNAQRTESGWAGWVDADVAYITEDEELRAFRLLATETVDNEVEAHPSGGSNPVFPSETWRHCHLDGLGDGVALGIVDAAMNGGYRQAERLLAQAQQEHPPAVKFKDLEALVNSRATFNVLPMAVRVDYLRLTDASVMANVTVQFENRDLQFQGKDEFQRSQVNVFGRIVTMSRRPVTTFEKPLEILIPAALQSQTAKQSSVFQQSVPLAPGSYKLMLVAKDLISGNVANTELTLEAPVFDDARLATSSLILADSIESVAARGIGAGMFTVDDQKVRPRVNGQFSRGEKMGIYLQVYNAEKPSGRVSYEIAAAGSGQQVLAFTEPLGETTGLSQINIAKLLPLQTLTPGNYTLRVRVDSGSQSVEKQAAFAILP